MTDTATIAAFVASERACYEWPEDTETAKAQRAAFCTGAAWAASANHAELARLREIEECARNVIKVWYIYGGCKPPVLDQLDALDNLLSASEEHER